MERSGTRPGVGIRDDDLVAVAGRAGPFASVVLTTEAAIENAAQHSEARWRAQRDSLASQGAPDAVLDAIDALVPDAHRRGDHLAVVADASGVLLVEHGPPGPERDHAAWGPLPSLRPVIAWRQLRVPCVVALVDRTGADLFVLGSSGPAEGDVVTVDGRGPVHKAAHGGWAESHEHNNVEEAWKDNAESVAAAIERLADASDARVVLIGGDEKAVALVQGSLGPRHRDDVVLVEAGRQPDSSADQVAADVERWVRTAAQAETAQLLRALRDEGGAAGRAAVGVTGTVAALQRAQVDVLLVGDDAGGGADGGEGGAGGGARLWFGTSPEVLGEHPEDVRSLGASDAFEGPAADVLVRAALGTGAAVRVVPGAAVAGGVAALLRWSAP